MKEYSKQIDYIMDVFEFGKAAKMMKAVGWTWGLDDVVPEEYELRKCARKLLKEVSEGKYRYTATGGFAARRDDDILSLAWGLGVDGSDAIEGDERQ